MTQFNAITASILQTPGVQQVQSADKSRQLRRAQEAERAGSAGEEVPETVPGADELSAVSDKHPDPRKRKKPYTARHGPEDDVPEEGSQLDLRA